MRKAFDSMTTRTAVIWIILGVFGAFLGGGISHISTDSNFWAAIFGALVGGILSLATQYIVILDQSKTRREQERRLAQQRARTISLKISKILKIYIDLQTYVADAHCKVHKDKWNNPALFLSAIVDDIEVIKFTDEELLLITDCDKRAVPELIATESNYAQIRSLINEYKYDRADFISSLGPDGGDINDFLRRHEANPNLKFANTNSLAMLLRQKMPIYYEECFKTVLKIKKAFADKLDEDFDEAAILKSSKIAQLDIEKRWEAGQSQ